MAGDRPRIFISYARVDWEDRTAGAVLTEAVRALESHTRAKLGDRGCTFWQDDKLRWGDKWRARLHQVIGDCDLFILMVSPGWLKSDVCREEYQAIKAREAVLAAGDRVLPIGLHPIKAKDVTLTQDHRALHEALRAIQFQDWSGLPIKAEADRTVQIRMAGEALAERVQEIRNAGTGPIPTGAARVARPPTDVAAVPVVSGNYYIPRRDQSQDERSLLTATLQLAFSGLAKITTPRGTLVFTVRQALLHTTVTGGRIANTQRAFPEGWNGPRAEVTRISAGAAREILRLRNEEVLDGEVLASRGDAGHVRLFDIEPNADKVAVTGVVKVEFEAVHVALDQSDLKRAAPADAERRRRLEAELAKLVLEECGGDTFTLEGDAR